MELIHIPIDPILSQILVKLLYLDYDNIIALRPALRSRYSKPTQSPAYQNNPRIRKGDHEFS